MRPCARTLIFHCNIFWNALIIFSSFDGDNETEKRPEIVPLKSFLFIKVLVFSVNYHQHKFKNSED
jgi:hypothetical protein